MQHQILLFFKEIFDRHAQMQAVLHEYCFYCDYDFTNNLASRFGTTL